MCARSIDIGTMWLVKGEPDVATEEPEFVRERNCFLQAATSDDTEETLKENNWTYAKYENDYYILGEDAIKLKNVLTINSKDEGIVATKIGELRRPMKDGILNTGEEKLSVAIIQKLMANLLGKPVYPGEVLCFCVPGDPVDRSLTVVFHRTMLTNFLKSLGYTVECIPEALAVIFSQRPIAEDPEDGEIPFTGVGFSCLPPGQKVITRSGFCNIENIEAGNQVFTKEGKWTTVIKPTSRHYKGEIITIHAYGHGSVSLTKEHLIWIKRQSSWSWVEAQNVIEGDYVVQPWANNYDTKEKLYLRWTERITCSDKYKTQKEVTGTMSELLGYFLGDGHIEQNEACIAWTFAATEKDNINRVKLLCQELFDKECSENEHAENDVRLKLYYKGFASYLRRMCYNENHEKIIPFDIEKMSDTCMLYMLRGLTKSDGWESDCSFHFSNTSLSLTQFYYLSAQKLGFRPSLTVREPRMSEIDGRTICGKKQEIQISCGGALSSWFISWMKNPAATTCKSFIEGRSVAKVNRIENSQYNGKVYDIAVQNESHSFCVPGFSIHNCGAGMMNICFALKKMPLINFSIAQSGDFIDREAAKVAGINVSAMTKYKEMHLDLNNIDYSDMRQAALDIFYQNVIENAISRFAEKFNQLDNKIEMPLEIVISGGTAMVPGFFDKFKKVIEETDLPFEVKAIRMAENPFYAVAHGCLVKAMASENKIKASKIASELGKAQKTEEPLPKKVKLK